jgi:hypothetical protein
MAKRRKTYKKTSPRKRRINGIGQMGGALTSALPLVGGALAASLVQNKVLKTVAFIPDNLKPAVPVVLGLYLQTMNNKMVKDLGAGMIAASGAQLVGQFVPGITGVDDDVIEALTDDVIEALPSQDNPLAGFDEDEISGYDEIGELDSEF